MRSWQKTSGIFQKVLVSEKYQNFTLCFYRKERAELFFDSTILGTLLLSAISYLPDTFCKRISRKRQGGGRRKSKGEWQIVRPFIHRLRRMRAIERTEEVYIRGSIIGHQPLQKRFTTDGKMFLDIYSVSSRDMISPFTLQQIPDWT